MSKKRSTRAKPRTIFEWFDGAPDDLRRQFRKAKAEAVEQARFVGMFGRKGLADGSALGQALITSTVGGVSLLYMLLAARRMVRADLGGAADTLGGLDYVGDLLRGAVAEGIKRRM